MFDPSLFSRGKRRDTALEDAAMNWLRKQPTEFRVEFVTQIVEQNYWGSHEFIRRAQLPAAALKAFLLRGISTADASNVKYFLGAVGEGLGWRRVLRFLRGYVRVDKHAVENAIYHLPWLMPMENQEFKSSYEELKALCKC